MRVILLILAVVLIVSAIQARRTRSTGLGCLIAIASFLVMIAAFSLHH